MPEQIIFLCDGMVEECCSKKGCYKNGGDCRHTSNVRYAKNFDAYMHGYTRTFWEREKGNAKSETGAGRSQSHAEGVLDSREKSKEEGND